MEPCRRCKNVCTILVVTAYVKNCLKKNNCFTNMTKFVVHTGNSTSFQFMLQKTLNQDLLCVIVTINFLQSITFIAFYVLFQQIHDEVALFLEEIDFTKIDLQKFTFGGNTKVSVAW